MTQNFQGKIEVRPVKESEKTMVELCIARSFSKDPTNPIIPDFIKIDLADSNFFWGVFVDGKPTAGLKLIPFEIQIEKTILRVLGLTGVGTDPDHRHKGYASMLLQGVHKYLRERGFDGTILHSAADLLYAKNGYEFAFCEWEGQVDPKKIFDIGNSFQKEPKNKEIHAEFYIRSDINQKIIDEIFELRNNSNLYRSRPYRVNRSRDYTFSQCLRLLERPNMIMEVLYHGTNAVGYLFADNKGDKLEIIEQYCKDDEHHENEFYILLWKNLIDQFDELPKNIVIKTYFQDEIIKNMIPNMGGKFYRLALVGNMAYIFDPVAILTKMKPTFEKRIKYAHGLNDRYFFILNIGDTQLMFEITPKANESIQIKRVNGMQLDNRNCPIFKIPKDEFAGLIFGYLSLDDLDLPNDPILNTLFPLLEPVWDYWHKY